MAQADFAYDEADAAGMPLAVSIFADRVRVRDEIFEDAAVAGLSLRECGPVAALLEGEVRALGEIVLLDCPQVSAAELAALSRLDIRAARSGAHLIISTSVAALDDVFACCDQSAPQILVDPSRAERAIALGRALASAQGRRLRELSDGDRLTLLRLTEQVGQLADRLGVGEGEVAQRGTFRFGSPTLQFSGPDPVNGGDHLARVARPPLPDPALVRRIIRQRQSRARFFDGDLFADPAWDILLDLTAAQAEHARVSVTSLCIASGVPPTTALRWIGHMIDAGLLARVQDETDRRRVFIVLTDGAAKAMARYFAEVGCGAVQPV
jgi:DNA-binding MarR family transcriptional regulator